MAVQSIPLPSQIRLQLSVGVGENRFVYRTVNNVKPTASDQDVYDVAVAIASLQSLPLVRVLRENDEELTEL